MKKLSLLLVVLLAFAAFGSADTIKLTSGSGQIYPYLVFPGYTFHFHGSGYDFSIPQFLDLFNGALVTCIPCDPTHLSNPLFIAGGPFLYVGSQVLDGIIQFNAVSFVSSLAPNGILTVKYTAIADLNLFLSDLITSQLTGPFVWVNPNQHWIITAQFKPDVGLSVYEFTGATLTSTPEPATMMLVGTGMLPLLIGLRKRLSRRSSIRTV